MAECTKRDDCADRTVSRGLVPRSADFCATFASVVITCIQKITYVPIIWWVKLCAFGLTCSYSTVRASCFFAYWWWIVLPFTIAYRSLKLYINALVQLSRCAPRLFSARLVKSVHECGHDLYSEYSEYRSKFAGLQPGAITQKRPISAGYLDRVKRATRSIGRDCIQQAEKSGRRELFGVAVWLLHALLGREYLMAVFCIGPFCVPMWQIIPFLFFVAKLIWNRVLRWLGLAHEEAAEEGDKIASTAPAEEEEEPTSAVTQLTDGAEWVEAAKLAATTSKMLVVDCCAEWCAPCKKLAPTFRQLSAEFGEAAVFVSVDVDVFPEFATAARVSALPTFQIYEVEDGGLLSSNALLQGLRKQDEIVGAHPLKLRKAILGAVKSQDVK